MSRERDSSASLRVRLLGGFDVFVDGQIVAASVWRQRRAAAIIKALSLEPGHSLHRERLMEWLWPQLDLAAQSNNLRQMLHHARMALEAAGMARGTTLTRDGDAVLLASPDSIWVDAVAFEHAVDHAWRTLTPESAQAALALYAGELLPTDRYDDWISDRRISLRTSYLALLSRLGGLYEERGQLSEALGVFQLLIASEPTYEHAYIPVVRLHIALGQRDVAQAQFDRLVSALARDGLEAEPATRTAALAMLAHRDSEVVAGALTPSNPAPGPPLGAGSMPYLKDALIGRERELAEIGQLLTSSRLVTLSGPGGIGKTGLALSAAALAGDRARHDVVFVDLTPIRDPLLVLPTIAEALNVRESHDHPLLPAIQERLSNRILLLVLDNFEHLMPAASVVADLQQSIPTLTILVTSRARLNVRGEREYAVGPLPASGDGSGYLVPSPAVELFARRAQEVRPGFILTAENEGAIAAICSRLDGVPLAIELAAARVRMLAPDAILERLRHPLALLTGGAVDRPERQQTMRKTIQWSVALLSLEEQALFQQLSVFAGGWTLDAAEAVADPLLVSGREFTVLDGLTSLRDKNLIVARDVSRSDVRFGMLETIREFGIEQLEAGGGLVATRDRHALWSVRFAEKVAPRLELSDQAVGLSLLDNEDDNLRAALLWIIEREHVEYGLRLVRALRLHWFMRGRLVEGCDWTLAIADLPGSEDYPGLCADALIGAGFFAREYGDFARAERASRRALTLSHRLNDRRRAADALVNIGFVTLQRGQYAQARSVFARALSTYRDIDHQQGIADAVSFLGLTLGRLGDDVSAAVMIEEAVCIWQDLDDRQALTVARPWLGDVYVRQGRIADAYAEFSRAMEIVSELGFDWGVSFSLDGFARIALGLDEHQLALDLVVTTTRIRAVAGIRPWPIDADTTHNLLDAIRAALGDETVKNALSNPRDIPVDELILAVREAFGRSRFA